jgi:acyl dehydratase
VPRVNASAEGKTYDPVRFELSPERIDAFHALFGGPPGVPLTVLTAAEFAVFPQVLGDPELGLDLPRVVHGTQEYAFRRPLRVGESLTVQAQIASIRHKGGNGFLIVEMNVRGDDGQVAALARSTMIERGASA